MGDEGFRREFGKGLGRACIWLVQAVIVLGGLLVFVRVMAGAQRGAAAAAYLEAAIRAGLLPPGADLASRPTIVPSPSPVPPVTTK